MKRPDSKVIRFELHHEDGTVCTLTGEAAQEHVRRLNALCALALAHGATVPEKDAPWEVTYRPPCGGSRCFRADSGTWIHSSKSYGTCSERPADHEATRRSRPVPPGEGERTTRRGPGASRGGGR